MPSRWLRCSWQNHICIQNNMFILIGGSYRSGSGDDPQKISANIRLMESFTQPIFRMGHIPVPGEWFALPLVHLAGSRKIVDDPFNEIFHPIAESFWKNVTRFLGLAVHPKERI